MPKYSSFVTPDMRLRRLEDQTNREAERKQQLDQFEQERAQELQAEIEREQMRAAELDQVDSFNTQIEDERARGLELDKAGASLGEAAGFERSEVQEAVLRGREFTTQQRPQLRSVLSFGGPAVDPGVFQRLQEQVAKEHPEETREFLEAGIVEERQVEEAATRERIRGLLRDQLGREPSEGEINERLALMGQSRSIFGSPAQAVEFELAELRGERRPFLTESFIPEPGLEAIEKVPVVGSAARREAEFLASPLGVASLAAFPTLTTVGAGGGIAAATAAREAGVSEEGQLIAQVLGNILTPGAGVVPARAVTGPARAGVRGGRELVGEAATRARLAPEAGGRSPTGPLRGGEEVPLRLPEELAGASPKVPPENPVVKLTRVIKEAKPARGETAKLQRQELQRRAGAATGALERGRGEEAFIRARAAQRGELPSAEFEAVRGQFTEGEITDLFEIVRTSDKAVFQGKPFNRVNAGQTLFKVMNGELPTRSEIRLIEEVFGRELAGAIERFRPLRERAWRAFVDALNLPRTLLASFDASFPLRQGVMTAARHPKEFFTNFPSMFRAGFSDDFARHIDDVIRSDNTLIKVGDEAVTVSELAESGGLFRATLGEFGPLTEREEFFLSTLARKIPGVRISERAFVTYGNKLRHDIFKTTLKNWERSGKAITDDEVQGLADLINKLTGRGNLGPANQAAPLLSAGFFAPRFAVSRPQAFLMMFHPQARVRNLAIQEIVTFVGTGLSILGLVKATGVADVEIDPRSSDFGKIRFGNTRLDFWGGNVQWARFVAQMITAQRKGLDGLIIPSDRLKVAERFARTKLSPPVGALVDSPLFAGENLIGEQFPTDALGIVNEIRKRTVPLAIQDLGEAIVNEGMSGGLAGLAFVGVGAQTFESRAEKRANLFQEKFNRPFSGKVDDYALIASDADFRAAFPLEGEAKESQTFFEETARGLGLPDMARSIKQGNFQAGSVFVEAIEDYLSTVSAVAARKRFGDVQNASPEYLGWREIRPEDFRDPETFEIDWDGYFQLKDEAFSGLDPQLQEAIGKLTIPGVDQAVLNDYQAARDLRREMFDMPKFFGSTIEGEQRLDEFMNLVRQELARAKREFGSDFTLTLPEAAIILAKRDFNDEQLGQDAALVLRNKAKRNPERDQFLIDHQAELVPFFPELFRRKALQEQLSDKLFEAVIAR